MALMLMSLLGNDVEHNVDMSVESNEFDYCLMQTA